MKSNLEQYKDYVKEYYATRDLSHNFEHIERIIKTSDKIITYGVDEEIDYSLLNFLRSFHGLNKKIELDTMFKEETKLFLSKLGWAESEIYDAFESLKRHCSNPQKIEEKIIYDSNYIEVIGAFGIARAFNSAGTRGQSIEEISKILKTQYYNVIEFQTAYGKKVSEQYKKFAEDFLLRLAEEISWYNNDKMDLKLD